MSVCARDSGQMRTFGIQAHVEAPSSFCVLLELSSSDLLHLSGGLAGIDFLIIKGDQIQRMYLRGL